MARASARQRGYTHRWDLARGRYVLCNPLCVECLKHGIIKQTEVVDHIVPHKGDQNLMWNEENWQALCSECHNRHKQKQEIHGYSSEVGQDGWPVDPDHPANRRK